MANILFYTSNEISPSVGGVERVASLMYEGLISRGHNVIAIVHYKINYDNNLSLQQFILPPKNKLPSLIKILTDYKIDIAINFQGLHNKTSALLIEALKGSSIKLISVLHNSFDSILWENTYLSKLMKYRVLKRMLRKSLAILQKIPFYKNGSYIYKYSDKVVLLSPSYIEEYKYFINRKTNKVTAIYNPNPFKSTSDFPKRKRDIVLFVGRLDNQKGLDKLLRIWKEVHNQNWELVIVGDGPLREDLISYSKQLGIDRSTTFLGKQNPIKYYNESRIFAMTSLYEGFPMVLIESMSRGCVPIIFDSYAAASEITYNKGILVTNNDEKMFANKLSQLMNNSDILTEMGTECLKYSKNFDPDHICNQWNNLILDLIN